MADAAVRFASVHRRMSPSFSLSDISFTINSGEITAIIGPSGCGKSTLLRCTAGLEPIDNGSIEVFGLRTSGGDGDPGPRFRSRLAYVPQQLYLWPLKTVRENLTLAPVARGIRRSAAVEKANKLLDAVGLHGRGDDYPAALSGGEQQRAAIARALIIEPELLLFDEITSALDPERTAGVLDVIQSLAAKGRTMMVVTHEISFANDLADRVFFMSDGRLLEQRTAREFFRQPETKRASDFLHAVRRER